MSEKGYSQASSARGLAEALTACESRRMAKKHTLDAVYGVSRDLPLNYVSRELVDDAFVDCLASDKHIVVFGSSKQGKTSLRKHSLNDSDYISITCSNKWSTLAPLHSAILKAAGFTVEQSSTKTSEGTLKVVAKLEGKVGVPFLAQAKAAGDIAGEDKAGESETRAPLELDPADVNDVIWALNSIGFEQYVVLEDFHYLPEEAQRDFSIALKAFHEHSTLCFIVVGVWLDENRLIQFNGDLTDRVLAVNADAWSAKQLTEVIDEGERLLDVAFDPTFKKGLVDGCFDSVSVVQVACHNVCKDAGVTATQDRSKTVGTGLDATEVIRNVVDQQSARYNTFLDNFAGGFQETALEVYRWLLLPVLSATPEQLEGRLRLQDIRKQISAHHPLGEINSGNVTQALKSAATLQVKLGISPIVLDYDQSTRRLNVVDRGFLIWLSHQDRGELLEAAGLPIPHGLLGS